MANSKRQFQSYKKPLRVLLKEIDQAADAYVRNGYREVIGENFLKTPTRLDELLDELEQYHPLNLFVLLHGKKALRKIRHEGESSHQSDWLAGAVIKAFQIHGPRHRTRALGRDIVRIAKSIVEPFEGLAEGIASLRVIIREMRKK